MPTLLVGDVVALRVSGFGADEQVDVELQPLGTALGGDLADADGVFEGEFEVPDLEAGEYTLAFASSSTTVTWPFRVAGRPAPSASSGATTGGAAFSGGGTTTSGSAGGLAATGVGLSGQLLLAALLVTAGLGATWAGLPRGRHERPRFAAA